MVDSRFRLLHSLVQSSSLLWKRIMQSWLFQTSGVEVNLIEWHKAGRRETKVCAHCLIFLVQTGPSFNREILLTILLVLRMSATILLSWFRRLTEASSWSSQYLVKNKYAGPGKVAINGASNGGELTPLLVLIRVLTSWRWYIGFLVCGSVVRAPEGTFGAAIAEGGVADLLKVIGLSHNIPYSFF